MDKLYILVFDRDASVDTVGLHNEIRDAHYISNWWHYLKSAYILRTSLRPANLRDRFTPYFGKNYFLIYELAPPHSDGYLEKKAWDWIQRQELDLS